MPEPRPQHRRRRRLAPALLALAGALVLSVTSASAADRTIEYQSNGRGIDLGEATPTGVTGTVKFDTDRNDKRALAAAKDQLDLLTKADERTAAATRADQRIAAIRELLAGVEEDQARLEAVIRERAVQRYKAGDDADLTFLLSGSGLADLVGRGRMLQQQDERDRKTLHDYEVTLARVELYQQVLEELRDINGTQARDLRDRADRLDAVVVASNAGHDEVNPDAPEPKGVKGTWYVMDGAFTAQLFLPNAGSGYQGGWRFPARAATKAQIQQVLNDTRIDLDASGYGDVLSGQIDGRLLDAMSAAAARFGYIRVTSLKSDHGVYTSSGNVSAHAYGCAMDIGTIGKTFITPGSQLPGGEVHQAVLFFNGLGQLKEDLAPHQVISLFDLGGATISMGDHGDHIHVGYSC